MKIAISGLSGCGNTSTSTILAKKLGYKLVNFTFKNLAEEKGVSFNTICKMAEESDDIDKELDKRQVEMAEQEKNSILASRLAIWMLKSADVKVFLNVSAPIRAGRIQKREGGTFEEQVKKTTARDKRDHERYLRIYSIDNDKYDFADLVINADNLSAEQCADKILKYIKRGK